ncbi:hypothetical protein B5F40_04665 [Gordonibacter sp. An230]|nr:hypothetical protein B5F40_04665 [Gordonibacter sp. An230]
MRRPSFNSPGKRTAGIWAYGKFNDAHGRSHVDNEVAIRLPLLEVIADVPHRLARGVRQFYGVGGLKAFIRIAILGKTPSHVDSAINRKSHRIGIFASFRGERKSG